MDEMSKDEEISPALIEYRRLKSDTKLISNIATQVADASAGFVNYKEASRSLQGLMQVFAYHIKKAEEGDTTPTLLLEGFIDRIFKFLVREHSPYQQLCQKLGFQVIRIAISEETSRLIYDCGGIAYQEKSLQRTFGHELNHCLLEWTKHRNKRKAISAVALPMQLLPVEDSFYEDLLDWTQYAKVWSGKTTAKK